VTIVLERNWHPVGDPESTDEAEALEALRGLLPDDPLCHAWTNLAFQDRTGHVNEVDVLLLVKQGMFVVELKGWHGHVSGRNNEWHVGKGTQRRDLRGNPVVQTDKKAKRLKGMLHEAEDEARTRVTIPYLAPVVVMHGRRSEIDLSDQTKGSVFGLDRFDVKGVPSFTELLKRPAKGRALDKPTADALVRLIQNCGLAPKPHSLDDDFLDVPVLAAATANGDASSETTIDLGRSAKLLDDIADEQLLRLGVAESDLAHVRAATEIESLIGRVPDEVWDDLEAVAGGEDVNDVVERRRHAEERFAAVSDQAETLGWTPEPTVSKPESEALEAPLEPTPSAQDDVATLTDLERQLREAFGDRVTSPHSARHRESKRTVPPLKAHSQSPSESTRDVVVTVETLLTLARTEAFAGRIGAAQALHDMLRRGIENQDALDWNIEGVKDLAARLQRFPLLSHRLEQLVDGLGETDPRARVQRIEPRAEIGTIWTGSDPGPSYSLLVRVPDVLDRRTGIFLSQLIGPAAARTVNEQLRVGRPDGGRIRVTDNGTVVSRRDGVSPWFVVGYVYPDAWFPNELVLAA
jgi:hypothetical protein